MSGVDRSSIFSRKEVTKKTETNQHDALIIISDVRLSAGTHPIY
jgi:hypothetical protein